MRWGRKPIEAIVCDNINKIFGRSRIYACLKNEFGHFLKNVRQLHSREIRNSLLLINPETLQAH